MPELFASLAVLVGFVAAFGSAGAAPTPGAASPAPVTCASPVPDLPENVLLAFAYDLRSRPVLRFIAALAAVPPADQQSLFESVVEAAATVPEREVQAALASRCADPTETYGTARALYLVVNRWTYGVSSDQERFDAFSAVTAIAVAALARGDGLAEPYRRTALLPFAGVAGLEAAPAVPSPPPGAACASPGRAAKALRFAEPRYPETAAEAGTYGDVTVTVQLDESGEVRSVKPLRDTLNDGIGAKEVVLATILAAAAGTYAPAFENCSAVPSELTTEMHYSDK
jgi:hypothetical protein